jgi:hypothetical protein
MSFAKYQKNPIACPNLNIHNRFVLIICAEHRVLKETK